MTDAEILSLAKVVGSYRYNGEDCLEFGFRELVQFARAIAKLQREKDAEICTNQRYMVLQPMRTYSAEDLCTAQKDSAKTLAKMILAQGKK